MKEFILMAFVLVVSCLIAILVLYLIEVHCLNNNEKEEYSDDKPDKWML